MFLKNVKVLFQNIYCKHKNTERIYSDYGHNLTCGERNV